MAESESHKRAKRKAAGKSGTTEKKLRSGKRLDAITKKKATEVERSGSRQGLRKAAKRLRESGKSQKVLIVPHKDIERGIDAMKRENISGTVRNIKGSKRTSVRKKESSKAHIKPPPRPPKPKKSGTKKK